MEIVEKLQKQNKLKRFGTYVIDKISAIISKEIEKTDCLFNNGIYTKRDMFEKMDAIADCASILELRKYDNGKIEVHNANYCHNPVVCPVCADRVSKRRKAIFSDPIKRAVRKFAVSPSCGDWKQEYPKGYTGVYMATATIKDGSNLKERIDLLQDSLKRMRKYGQKRKGERSSGEWSKVQAGISNIEIKIGSGSGLWHVHSHFLLFTDSPIDIKTKDSPFKVNAFGGSSITLSKFNYEWFQASGGEGINFDVSPIKFRENVSGHECKTFEESVEAQAAEIIKYSAQLSDKKGAGILTAAQYAELIQRRGNRRLFNALGLLRCDKRNPDSLMTITERELRRLEYIDNCDNEKYEIYSSLWQNGGTYGKIHKQEGAIFKDSDDMRTNFVNIRRRAFSAQTAIYQGEYRKARNDLLKSRYLHSIKEVFEDALNTLRDSFRNKVNHLWENFNDADFIPYFLREFDSSGMHGFKQKYLRLV
jgi:plasmid rolling circle replication initiator protein Rep